MGNQFEAVAKEVKEREPQGYFEYHEWEALEDEIMRQEAVEQLASGKAHELGYDHLNQIFETSIQNPLYKRDRYDDLSLPDFVKRCKDMSLPDTQREMPFLTETPPAEVFIFGPMHTAQDAMDNHQVKKRNLFELYSNSPSSSYSPTPSDPVECRIPQKGLHGGSITEPPQEKAAARQGISYQVRDAQGAHRIWSPGSLIITHPRAVLVVDEKYQKFRKKVVHRIEEAYLPCNPEFIFRFCSDQEAGAYFKWSVMVGFEVFAAWENHEVGYQGGFYDDDEFEAIDDFTIEDALAQWEAARASFRDEGGFLIDEHDNDHDDDTLDADVTSRFRSENGSQGGEDDDCNEEGLLYPDVVTKFRPENGSQKGDEIDVDDVVDSRVNMDIAHDDRLNNVEMTAGDS